MLICEERDRMQLAYENCSRLYLFALKQQQMAIRLNGGSPHPDLDKLAEDARNECQRVRVELQKHLSEHGC
jgi:hypothetical protein